MQDISGSWIANLEKSQRHANHQFQSATLQLAVDGTAVTLVQSGVNMSGRRESSTLTLQADGEPHAVSPGAPGVVVVTRWLERGTSLETVAKRGDEVVGIGTYEVSDDGSILVARVNGTDAQGAAFEQVIVFDRETALRASGGGSEDPPLRGSPPAPTAPGGPRG